MFIEQWKDTAFGTDYGGDFRDFLEQIPSEKLTLADIYGRSDLKKYFEHPELLNQRTDNNVSIGSSDFEHFVHYEEAVIALAAIIAESELNGSADLTNAYGSKKLTFDIAKEELTTVKNALTDIHDNPIKFILFELCGDEEREETLSDIADIINKLQLSIDQK